MKKANVYDPNKNRSDRDMRAQHFAKSYPDPETYIQQKLTNKQKFVFFVKCSTLLNKLKQTQSCIMFTDFLKLFDGTFYVSVHCTTVGRIRICVIDSDQAK